MATFTLSSGGNTFDFDPVGGVSVSGQPVGSWTTNRSNQIVVKRRDGSTVTLNVTWAFNNKNQLTIGSQGTEVFNFATTGLRNSFITRDTILRVQPDRLNTFVFELHGAWDMDTDHNLTFTINGTTSVIDGFVSDPLGRFIYHFANKDNFLQTNVLGFVGTWQSQTDPNGTPLLEFHYQRENNVDGTPGSEGVFKLPKAAAIERTTNQLSYTYDKGNKTLSIKFQGMLMISPDFQITYIVQRQVSSSGEQMVSSTTLGFDAMITTPKVHGDLSLTLTKADGTVGNTTFTIGGDFEGVLGKTALQVGFSFTQTFGPAGQISRTAAFNGQLRFSEGQVQWTFSATGSTIELAVGADIKLGPVSVDERLNLKLEEGKVVGVTFLLGVDF